MNHTRNVLFRAGLGLALAAGFSGLLSAQTASTAPAATSSEPVTLLEKLTVSDVPLENQVLPTVRPIGSVLGDDRSIIDTPRSVSSVNKAWMEERGIKDAMDFGQFAPGVYSAAQYGVPATPQIRGDLGELYLNGQREKYSRNSVLPSFNGVEAMDIIKGPGSAVYGPQGQGPGGYVNLVTKQPYFDTQHTEFTTTQGYWTTGRSYYNPQWTLDTSGPISPTLAYRISILERDGDGYYLGTKNESHDIFAALSWKPTSSVTTDLWVQWYKNRFNEISGVNRVTQAQIDHQDYIAGSVTGGPAFALLDPATARTVKLAPYTALVAPEDYDRSERYQGQAKTTIDLGVSGKVVNLLYAESRTSSKYESYGYSEFVPTDFSVNDRLEWHTPEFKLGGTTNSAITGIDLKYEKLKFYQDFSTEPFFIYDLATWPYYAPPLGNGTVGGGLPVPGKPGFGGGSDSDNHFSDVAAFYQHDVKFTPKVSGVIGVRLDHIAAEEFHPALVGQAQGPKYTGNSNDFSTFNSLIYKPSDTSSVYVTYNRVNAILGSGNFGGIAGGSKAQLEASMKSLSQLTEVGYKESFLNNTLYFSAAVFRQTKRAVPLIGPPYKVKDDGLELDSVYQPNKHLTINAKMTFQNATAYGPSFYEQTGSYTDGYPSSIIVDGKPGTGHSGFPYGSPNYGGPGGFAGYTPAGGKMKAPGVPPFLANFFVAYKFDNGFGFGVGPQFNGQQNANDEGTLKIPFQYELDGYVFYKSKKWDVQVSFKNLLNEALYDPIDVSFAGNDVVFRRQGLGASLTFRYRL